MNLNFIKGVELGLDKLLIELNEAGYTTFGSCSGHRNIVTGNPMGGYITFVPGAISTDDDVVHVRAIVSSLTAVPFRVRKGVNTHGIVTFEKPLEGSTIQAEYGHGILGSLGGQSYKGAKYPKDVAKGIMERTGATLEEIKEQDRRCEFDVACP